MSERGTAGDSSSAADQSELEELAVGLAQMARDLIAQDSVQATLDRILAHAVDLVEGCEHAGVLLLHGRSQVETAAASSDLVRRSDEIQGELGEGPCFDAAFQKQQVYRIADVETTVEQWPQYAPRARELGIGSMMGFLLFTDEGDLGALDLYSHEPNTFTQHSELVGWLLASHAAVAFSGARTTAQMRSAIDTRQRYKLTDDRAFELIKKVSQDRNIKLRDLAEQISTTGEAPGEQ